MKIVLGTSNMSKKSAEADRRSLSARLTLAMARRAMEEEERKQSENKTLPMVLKLRYFRPKTFRKKVVETDPLASAKVAATNRHWKSP